MHDSSMHEHVPLIDRIEKEEVVVTDTELANSLNVISPLLAYSTDFIVKCISYDIGYDICHKCHNIQSIIAISLLCCQSERERINVVTRVHTLHLMQLSVE